MPRTPKKSNDSAATIGYEAQLWQMADALRGSMEAAEYKHVTLGRPNGARRVSAEDANQYRALGQLVDDAMAGITGFVLANGSMSSNQSDEGERSLGRIEEALTIAVATPMTGNYS